MRTRSTSRIECHAGSSKTPRAQRGFLLLTTLLGVAGLLAIGDHATPAHARCRGRVPILPGGIAPRDDGPCRDRSQNASVPTPEVEGPITGPGNPFAITSSFDLASVGYEQAEFFIAGTARSFAPIGTLARDGMWQTRPDGAAEYRSRILVYRPIDARAFNGTVWVEWLNVSGGLDAAPDWTTAHTEIIRKGAAWVGVSAQYVGVEGAGPSPLGISSALKTINPARYGSLIHPGDVFSYDMFSQVGQALRAPSGIDPLGGLTPKRIIAVGESQSAFRLTTYVNAIDRGARIFDGFLIHSRGRSSAPITQTVLPEQAVPSSVRIRSDVRVPVMMFQTETDLIELGYVSDRQPDTARIRLWEVAGTAHADTYTLSKGGRDVGNDPAIADLVVTAEPIPGIIRCDSPINSGPQHWVLKAAFAALERWVRTGESPPRAPRIATEGDPPALKRDALGNVIGGIRTSYVDAPIATLSGGEQTGGGFCRIFGSTTPFDEATLDRLYPNHQTYVSAVADSNDRAVRQGFLLRPDAALIEAAAEASSIGR